MWYLYCILLLLLLFLAMVVTAATISCYCSDSLYFSDSLCHRL